MTENIFFYTGLAFLTMHEVDAVRCREWRIFPGLSMLDDKSGRMAFLIAHIPLFYFIYWQLVYGQDKGAFMNGLSVFMMVHLGLHILYLRHRNNEFKDMLSWTIIIGSALSGMLHLLV